MDVDVQCGLAALIAAYVGPASAFMVEAFPMRVRCSVSFAYSASLSIFGGTAPMVAVFTIQHTQDDLSPALDGCGGYFAFGDHQLS
jgi:MHS family proline/betaine transporter-like MFS transporter